jgi:hypothetical protein
MIEGGKIFERKKEREEGIAWVGDNPQDGLNLDESQNLNVCKRNVDR